MRYGEWKQKTRTRQPQGTLTTVSGVPPLLLTNSDKSYLADYKIYGKNYRSGTPSPSSMIPIQGVGTYNSASGKYEIGLRSKGKNITNIPNQTVSFTNTYYTEYFPQNLKVILLPNTVYTLSFDYVVNSASNIVSCAIGYGGTSYMADIVGQSQYPNQTSGRKIVTFTTPAAFVGAYGIPYLRIRFARLGAVGTVNVSVSNVMVCFGSESAYEAYTYQDTTISIAKPLYEGDCIEFANRRIYRNNMELSVDENSNWISMPAWSTASSFSAYLDLNGTKVNGLSNIECTHFPYYSDIIGKDGIRGNLNYGLIYFSMVGITTLAQWKAFLSTEKAAGRTVKIVFPMVIKVYDFPSNLPYIPTEKGTNGIEPITTVQPTSMEVTYYVV